MAELLITTQEVKDMLRARMLDLSRPEGFQGGVFCDEVTHQRTGRRADAIFLGMSNSKGKSLQGFEIKVSRADWLSELRDVDKAETVSSSSTS